MKLSTILAAGLAGVAVLRGQVYGASVKEKLGMGSGKAVTVGVGSTSIQLADRGLVYVGDGIPVRLEQDEEFGATTGLHFLSAGKTFVDVIYKKIWGRHEGDHTVVTTKLADVVIITTSCLTSTKTVEGSSIETTVQETKIQETPVVHIEQPSTTEVRHSIPPTDVHVVTPATSIETHPSATETPVVIPSFTDVYTPLSERSIIITVIEQSTKVIDTCPPNGCEPIFQVPTETAVPSTEVPGSIVTLTSSNIVTSYSTELESTIVESTTITPAVTTETPEPTPSQGIGAQVLIDSLYKVVVAIVAVHIGY